jgi:hypothetical protein
MRIWAITEGIEKEAYKVGRSAFLCFPPSENDRRFAKKLPTIEQAAVFLIENPGWGIRMNPGRAIIYDNIQISLRGRP